MYGAPMLFALLWFAIDARKWFKGPRVNAKHAMIGKAIVGRAELGHKQELGYPQELP